MNAYDNYMVETEKMSFLVKQYWGKYFYIAYADVSEVNTLSLNMREKDSNSWCMYKRVNFRKCFCFGHVHYFLGCEKII